MDDTVTTTTTPPRTTVTRVGSAEWEQAKREGRAVYIGRACRRAKDPMARVASVFANQFAMGMDPFKAMRLLERENVNCVIEFRGLLDREKAVECYRALMVARLRGRLAATWTEAVASLSGKVLGCWCHPEACHGDVLAAMANGEDPR